MYRGLFVLLAGIVGIGPVVGAEAPEFRGVWITRFEWPDQDAETCKQRITQIFDTLAENNFNAAVFQIRGAAETLYPSELEPWSPLLGEKDPGFDPVAFAIEAAHARGIAFHAYMNPMPLRSTRWREPPTSKNHLWYSHGPESDEPWICMNEAGEPSREEYYYMSAAVPEVHAHLRRVVMDVVNRYDVDGIHFDRIRSPGARYGHNPIGDRRFHGRGNPNRKEWADWQREQLDKFVNDMAAEIREAKPEVIFSCSAWGIYNRHNIEGYDGFSSGYHDYYQDTWNWCRLGAMDLLMPMIYWDIPDPKPNYDEVVQDFVRGVGGERVVGGQSSRHAAEIVNQVRASREANAAGSVLFSFRSASRRDVLAACKNEVYTEPVPVPTIERVTAPKHGAVLGTVTDENGEPLVDAWVSLAPAPPQSARADVFRLTWPSSADGRFAFLNVPPGQVVVTVEYPSAPTRKSEPITVEIGKVARVELAVRDSALARAKPYVDILAPADGSTTDHEVVHLLGRTQPDHQVTVGGVGVPVYATGAFVRDNIAVAMGENAIDVSVIDAKGRHTVRRVTVTRTEAKPVEPPKTFRIIEPAEDTTIRPGDRLAVQMVGPAGYSGEVEWAAAGLRAPMTQVLDADGKPTGEYTALLCVPATAAPASGSVQVKLAAKDDVAAQTITADATVELWDAQTVGIGETTSEWTGITAGLHTVRLGGPWVATAPRGTRLEIIGRQGPRLHVRYSPMHTGWISARQVNELPTGTLPPHNYFTSCSIDGDEREDRVVIPLKEKVAFTITPETEPTNRLYVDLYNTHHALTWASHKSGARIVGAVEAEQVADDCLRLTIPLRCRQIWGFWAEVGDHAMTLHIRRPPRLAEAPASPLKGLRIALEAGHGGSGSGAVGNLGTKEKTINANAVRALQRALEQRGAETVLVRPGDSAPSLSQRVERTNEANADLFVSIHANAASTARGYLRVSGTSTYYREKHGYLAAARVYEKLLDLGWDEFGIVGNFSYSPLGNTRVLGILVEQAFMSNPADEARMLDPEYQKAQADAIAEGLEAFLSEVRE